MVVNAVVVLVGDKFYHDLPHVSWIGEVVGLTSTHARIIWHGNSNYKSPVLWPIEDVKKLRRVGSKTAPCNMNGCFDPNTVRLPNDQKLGVPDDWLCKKHVIELAERHENIAAKIRKAIERKWP